MRFPSTMLLLAAMFAAPATASAYSATICFEYEVDFADRLGGDWWRSTADKTARGVRVQVITQSGVVVFNDYASASTGCTPTLSMGATPHLIRAYTIAKTQHNNLVMVLDDDESHVSYSFTVASAFTPYASGTYTFPIDNPSSGAAEDVVNVAAAAGYAVNKRNGGHHNQTFSLYNQICPSGTGSCMRQGGAKVYLSPYGKRRKFIIAHEVGHAVGAKRDEFTSPAVSASSAASACDEWTDTSHDLVSKEWQSTGFIEGYAHFYAATVFNDPAEYDCEFFYYKSIDFDKNGFGESPRVRDCEVGGDYLGTHCDAPLTNRSTEYDWLRFLWDLHTNEGETFTNITDILDRANPRNWTEATVYDRLRDAAIVEGVSASAWDDIAAYNGVTR